MIRDAQGAHFLLLHYAPDDQSKIVWQRIQADGELQGESGEIAASALGRLAERYAQDLFCLMVPTAAVGLHSVHLPGRHDAAGLRALPWLLEDNLASAPEEVTITPFGSVGEMLWVAVVAKEQLSCWLAPFNEAGINLHKLVPDALLLPWAEGEITALQWGERWLVRTDRWQGAEMESNWLPFWHDAWQRTQPQPVNVNCYGTPPAAALEQWQICPTVEPLVLLARHVPQAPSILSRQNTAKKMAWHAPLIASVAVLALLFAQQGVEWWAMKRQGDGMQQQLLQQFHQRFPDQSEQHWQATLRRIVQKTTQQDGANGLMQWLAQWPALPPGITLQQLHYRSSPAQLQLRLLGDAAQVQRARQLLETRFRVSSTPDGNLTLEPLEATP